MKTIKGFFSSIWEAAKNTIDHDGIEHAGYMAFLGILAFFPFLVFLVSITGFIGESEIGWQFVSLLLEHLPENVLIALKPRIEEIISGPPQSLLTLAILGAIWTASSAVEGLRTILNRVYRISTPPPYIWRRLLSIVQFLVLTLMITITMIILIVFPIAIVKIDPLADLFSIIDPLWTYLRYITISLTLFLLLSLTYCILPNVKLKFVSVFPGALLVVILWIPSAMLLSYYFTHFKQVNLIYGSLGGVIAALLFLYVINMIFIFGAEFNYSFQKFLNDK